MVENLPCKFRAFHYLGRNRIASPPLSSSPSQEMTMTTHNRPRTFQPAAILPWLVSLGVWMLARSLHMPEPLVHSAGVFVFAQVQAAETRAAKTFCPVRLLRQLRNWLR
jgi:hypothetical protein